MIDSHCHLTNPRLSGQIDAVLARAAVAGVTGMVTIGTDPDDASAALTLCERYRQVRCAIGIHPNECERFELTDVQQIGRLSAHPAVVAIGEIGLDYHYKTDRPRQRTFFEAALALAAARTPAWPVVIHCREAVADALAVLRDFPAVRCVFHCFTGAASEAAAVIAAGHSLGFTGPVTFKKNDALRDVVRQTPIDRILIETDAPYLSPEPVRKQGTCEPSFVAHTLAVVAGVHGLSVAETDAVTTRNTKAFYGLP
ncbi:MAG TPA: TatD family hydrolase [Tepidisphaeraceae bacterium]|jgi:TatD DNase family protein